MQNKVHTHTPIHTRIINIICLLLLSLALLAILQVGFADDNKLIDMQVEAEYIIDCCQLDVKLKKNYLKIFNLLPAPAQTFVFLALLRVGSFALVHADSQGTILFQHKFEKAVDSIALGSESEVLALQGRLNQLLVVRLPSHECLNIPFQFINEEPDQSSIFTFTKSKYVCIVEKGRYNDNRLKLSYFKTPLNKESVPFAVYQSDEEWNCQYLLKKGNEDSIVLWYRPRNDQEIQLKVHQIESQQSKFSTFKIKNEIGSGYGQQISLQLAILNAWQISPNKFLLVCNTQKTSLGYKNKQGVVNNNFIWDITEGKLRQTNFWFDQRYNDFLIDVHHFGQFAVFRTYSFENGVAETTPCYYVHKESEKIVAQDSWQCSYKVKFQYPIHESIIVEGQYENANVSQFRARVKRLKKASK